MIGSVISASTTFKLLIKDALQKFTPRWGLSNKFDKFQIKNRSGRSRTIISNSLKCRIRKNKIFSNKYPGNPKILNRGAYLIVNIDLLVQKPGVISSRDSWMIREAECQSAASQNRNTEVSPYYKCQLTNSPQCYIGLLLILNILFPVFHLTLMSLPKKDQAFRDTFGLCFVD